MRNSSVRNSRQSLAADDVFGVVTVAPYAMEAISLGLFEAGRPEPELYATVEPDIGDLLGASLERQDDDGEYRLTCHLQNYGGRKCRVTVTTSRTHGSRRLA